MTNSTDVSDMKMTIIIIILVLHLRLSSKLPQRRMRLCSMLEKFSFKQFFKHRKSYIRVLQTRRETVPGCWTSMKESTRANCLGGGGWHKQVWIQDLDTELI